MRYRFFLVWVLCSFWGQAQYSEVGLNVRILSTDLTEDGTRFSSGNDELVLVVSQDSGHTLVLTERFTFDSIVKRFDVDTMVVLDTTKKVEVALLEQDTYKSTEAVARVFLSNYTKLKACHQKRDYTCIRESMDGDDVLFIHSMERPSNVTQNIEGVYRMDRYSYTLYVFVE